MIKFGYGIMDPQIYITSFL